MTDLLFFQRSKPGMMAPQSPTGSSPTSSHSRLAHDQDQQQPQHHAGAFQPDLGGQPAQMVGGEGAMGHAPAAPADEEPLYVNAKQVLFFLFLLCVYANSILFLFSVLVLVILSANHMNSCCSYVYPVLVSSYPEAPCCP